MKILILIIGVISSIAALTAINITAINEAIYCRLFIISGACSVISILVCLFSFSVGGWLRYISFLFLGGWIYTIYNVIFRYFG
ncbi:hypothetical protein PVM12_11325 [Enterobacter soli]|uniref:hypothetical protein n=1 Tax=Enterobacter soli TaxID=885040 RepID=UPI0023788AB8|nr:hypothetical protein [Enterobacter soli]MDD9244634.1 hypothetical protein [Enterobacter soli]